MPMYRARVVQIDHAAIDKGIRPTGHALAIATGLPAGTINAMRNGRAPSQSTMAAIVTLLGGVTEDYFEIVEDDPDAVSA